MLNRKLFLSTCAIYVGKRMRRPLKTIFPKFIRILIVSFLVFVMLSYVSGWGNTAEAWDGVPIIPGPTVALDLYTQKGGIGTDVSGGEFTPGENVVLYVNVASDGLPAENRSVLFEIEGPADYCYLTSVTNSSGVASVDFMVPLSLAQDKVFGTWCVTAQTGLDMDTVGDNMNFEVVPIIHAPEFPTLNVLLLVFILTIATTIILKRESRQLKVAADNLVQKADLTRLVSRNATL
jgi:hypothetical protein